LRHSLIICLSICLLSCYSGYSQLVPYSFTVYQYLHEPLHEKDSQYHSSIKPVDGNDSVFARTYDSLINPEISNRKESLLYRKLFREHLIEVKNPGYSVNIDFLPGFEGGYDFSKKQDTWLNSRGFEVSGTVGKKFSFTTAAYENQARFPAYITNYINANDIIPGTVNDKYGPGNMKKDWAFARTRLNFELNKHFSFTLGQDKNFIGDGYRSMLLSDVAANYPFLKIVTTLGKVQYVNIWAQFQDLRSPELSYENGFRKKWGAFHYLDWKVTNKLSAGFFDAIIWQDADSSGKRGFDFYYLNPFIFLRPVEGSLGSPDNALMGLNLKYQLGKNLQLYGQLALDEFIKKELLANKGSWVNKYGIQAGVKSFDFLKVKNLNALVEFNTARPYTYSHEKSITNYGHYNEPLAHPFGANFRELLTIWDYSYKRWQVHINANYSHYGLDSAALDFGKNIYKSYNSRIADYGNYTGQGLKTSFKYLESSITYLLNPKNNLRIELRRISRVETNAVKEDRTSCFSIGLRSSFLNTYHDY
jgi:hypothetical protein